MFFTTFETSAKIWCQWNRSTLLSGNFDINPFEAVILVLFVLCVALCVLAAGLFHVLSFLLSYW